MAQKHSLRWFGLLGVGALLVGLFAAGWVGASAFQSPEQREAAAEPPAPGPVVEPVVVGRLADEVQLRAVVGTQVQRTLAPSALPDPAVVTANPVANGDSLDHGDLVLEVSGRPVFVLPGSFPFYRDLKSGMTGPDVEQLQRGLTSVGYEVGDWELGTFGRSTSWAVRRYYSAIGYEPLKDGPECDDQEASGETGNDAEENVSEPGRSEEAEPTPKCEDPGPMVPRSEVVVATGSLPASLAGVPSVGTTLAAGDPVATVTNGQLVARAGATDQTATRLTEGMDVELTTDDGKTAAATVTSINAAADDDTEAGEVESTEIVITPSEALDSAWNGQDVLARIAIDVVSDDGLLVPSIAVALSPQGEAYVSVRGEDGAFTKVAVEVLGELAGQSAVKPQVEGTLAEGDQVRVA